MFPGVRLQNSAQVGGGVECWRECGDASMGEKAGMPGGMGWWRARLVGYPVHSAQFGGEAQKRIRWYVGR